MEKGRKSVLALAFLAAATTLVMAACEGNFSKPVNIGDAFKTGWIPR